MYYKFTENNELLCQICNFYFKVKDNQQDCFNEFRKILETDYELSFSISIEEYEEDDVDNACGILGKANACGILGKANSGSDNKSDSESGSGSDSENSIDLSNPHVNRSEISKILGMRPRNLDYYRRAFVHKSINRNVKRARNKNESCR